MAITLAQTEKMMQAAIAQAQGMGLKVSVSVVDPHGNLIGFLRMDGARFITADISRGKAAVAATFGQPSATLEKQKDWAPMQSLLLMSQGRLVFRQGAVPLMRGDEIEGAIGVSGGTSQEDEDIAKAASAGF